jgi:hypothetical protein
MRGRLLTLGVVALLAFPGCGKGPQGVPVRGQVLNGTTPVTGMLIMSPAEGNSGPKVMVTLDSTGSFELSAEEGPAVGDYLVSLQTQEALTDTRSSTPGATMAPADLELSGSAPKSWPQTFVDGENILRLDVQSAQ